MAEAPGQEPDERVGETEDAHGDAGRVHELGRQDEQRDGQQDVVLQRELHLLRQDRELQRRAAEDGRPQGRKAQRQGHGQAHHQEDHQPEGQHEDHSAPPGPAVGGLRPVISR